MPDTPRDDDFGLIDRITSHHREANAAFEALLGRYERLIWHILLREVGLSREEAEDAFQKVALSVFRGLPDFRRESAFATWLHTIAVNEGRKAVRNRSRDISLDERPTRADGSPGEGPADRLETDTLSELNIPSHAAKAFWKCIFGIPQIYLMPWLLRELCGLDYQAIAEVLGLKLSTVGVYIMRARTIARGCAGQAPE